MALFVKDPDVAALADRLARLRQVSKTEAVRTALQNELTRAEAQPSLVEIGVAFCRRLRGLDKGQEPTVTAQAAPCSSPPAL